MRRAVWVVGGVLGSDGAMANRGGGGVCGAARSSGSGTILPGFVSPPWVLGPLSKLLSVPVWIF